MLSVSSSGSQGSDAGQGMQRSKALFPLVVVPSGEDSPSTFRGLPSTPFPYSWQHVVKGRPEIAIDMFIAIRVLCDHTRLPMLIEAKHINEVPQKYRRSAIPVPKCLESLVEMAWTIKFSIPKYGTAIMNDIRTSIEANKWTEGFGISWHTLLIDELYLDGGGERSPAKSHDCYWKGTCLSELMDEEEPGIMTQAQVLEKVWASYLEVIGEPYLTSGLVVGYTEMDDYLPGYPFSKHYKELAPQSLSCDRCQYLYKFDGSTFTVIDRMYIFHQQIPFEECVPVPASVFEYVEWAQSNLASLPITQQRIYEDIHDSVVQNDWVRRLSGIRWVTCLVHELMVNLDEMFPNDNRSTELENKVLAYDPFKEGNMLPTTMQYEMQNALNIYLRLCESKTQEVKDDNGTSESVASTPTLNGEESDGDDY